MGDPTPSQRPADDWPASVHRVLSEAGVRQVAFVPDAGLKSLIEHCQADQSMQVVPLTSEEEGVGLALGAWLGGGRSVLLLQSSGVGNTINVLGTVRECRLPFVMIVTMRGEEGEFNPWQMPMGRATPRVLEAMGVRVMRPGDADAIAPVVQSALVQAFEEDVAVAVLISQSIVGIKSFQEQRDR